MKNLEQAYMLIEEAKALLKDSPSLAAALQIVLDEINRAVDYEDERKHWEGE